MVLAVPKAFILNSLLENKLSDSLFTINSFIINVISINVKKYQKIPKISYSICAPPVSSILLPVTHAAVSLSRYIAAPVMSSGCA